MAHTPPINKKELRKKGVFDSDRFYEDLAASCGYISKEMSERYYLALVRLITARLKKDEAVRLPHLGDFALVLQKEKLIWAGQVRKKVPAQKVLKFYPIETWRKYFNQILRSAGT